jgi:hypothetical protein
MDKRVKALIMLLIFTGSCLVAPAQQKQPGEKRFEVDMVWGFAQGSFEDNLDRPMPGVVLSFGARTPNLPLVLSTEIGWLGYGFDNYLEIQYPDTPISVLNVGTKNSIVLTHFVMRVVPYEGIIAPYVDGLVGLKYISTSIDVESEAIIDDDGVIIIDDGNRIFTSSTYNAFATSYGFGAGVNIQIFSGNLGFQNPNSSISVNMGAQYLFGSKANYLTENSIQPGVDRIRFERVESNTNMLIPKIGFSVGI